MKAFALIAKNNAKIVEREEPAISSREDLIVNIGTVSICGTDSHIYSGDIPTGKLPIIMGHEGGGTIAQVGSNVSGFKEGDKVLIDPNIVDGTCELCKRGLTNLCSNGGILGRDVDGLFAERIVLNPSRVYKLNPEINEEIVPLIQPLSTVVRGMSRLKVDLGETILVIGLGATGLLFSRLCKLRGASVIGARRTWLDHMTRLAREFGVDYSVNTTKDDLSKEVLRITDGKGPDTIILTANAPEMIQMCLDLVKPGGSILQFFNSHGSGLYETYELYIKEVNIISSRSSLPADFKESIELAISGKVSLEKLITGRYNFDRAEVALHENENRKQNIKVVIKI